MYPKIALLACLLLLSAGALSAQAPRVTPAVPLVQTPTNTPVPDDPRLSVCTGPTLPGFEPHIIREGERLADLLRGIPNVSVMQIAALNCIDNPEAPPVGAVIWLPQRPTPDTAEAGDTAAPAAIRSFSASAETVANQSVVDFSWEATGSAAYFYACPVHAEEICPRPLNAQPLPLDYTLRGIGGFAYPGAARFRLEVEGSEGAVTEDVSIEVTCTQESLLPASELYPCPQDPPLTVFGAWQPFQGGIMMWFFDRREIWVLLNEGKRVLILPDTYTEGDPELDDTAPDGYFVPIRGFGQAWDRLGRAEGIMGWGITDSIGFDSARQAAGPRSFTTYIQGPGDTVYAITHIPQLDIAYWTQVAG